MQRTLPRFLLVVYLMFILTLTLLILGGKQPTLNLIPFRSMVRDWRFGGQPLVVNFWGKILAFVPFGMLLPLVRLRPTKIWHALVLAGTLRLTIEILQYVCAKRNADIDDVILNTLGGLLGHALICLWQGRTARNFPPKIVRTSSNVA